VRARILPLDDLAEYGKANSVALLISMTPEEAQRMLNWMGPLEEGHGIRSVQELMGYLRVVARQRGKYEQDPVNTDGRSGLEGAKTNATPEAEHSPADPRCTCDKCFPWG
jgi:hypothetical protein